MVQFSIITIVALLFVGSSPFAYALSDGASVMTIIRSSVNTGGNTANGGDGADGADGTRGADGASGQHGTDGRVVTGGASGYVEVTTTINGKTMVSERHTASSSDGISLQVHTSATEGTATASVDIEPIPARDVHTHTVTAPPASSSGSEREEDIHDTHDASTTLSHTPDPEPSNLWSPVKMIITLFTKLFSYVGSLFS